MYDADAIEAINFDQLVTATDRLLIRGGVARRRPSVPSLVPVPPRGSSVRIPPRGSSVWIPQQAPLARGSHPHLARPCDESTSVAHAAPSARAQVFALTVVIPTLVGIAVGLAALL